MSFEANPNQKIHYVKQMILQGEGQELDFKYNISSSKKIAKTLCAFANTQGGTLLIGVKDTGKITGIYSEEEIYMLDAAAQMYCKPEIKFEMKEWEVDGKIVLEVYVPPGDAKPYFSQDDDGKWLVYIRVADQNLLANRIIIEIMKRQRKKQSTLIHYRELETLLLNKLKEDKRITLKDFVSFARIPKWKAEKIIINLASIGIIGIEVTPVQTFYYLTDENTLEKQQEFL
jgi:hypothetical protein